MIVRRIAAFVLVLAACVHPMSVAPDIVGTWRLVEYWDRPHGEGPKIYPFGEHPSGFIVYDRAGNVFVQIAKSPQTLLPPERRTAEDFRAMIGDYAAYFGTYTVDAARRVVTHHVVADVRREYTGTDQPRPFRIDGDELIIGDSKTWERRLVRVR